MGTNEHEAVSVMLASIAAAPAHAAPLILAQVPSQVKTGFQYGLGLLFMIGFPEIYAKTDAYSHEELVRKRIPGIMNTNERRGGYREEVRAYVGQNPEIKQEVERRLKRIPEDQRESAFVRVARNVAANFGMRQAQQPAQGMSAG